MKEKIVSAAAVVYLSSLQLACGIFNPQEQTARGFVEALARQDTNRAFSFLLENTDDPLINRHLNSLIQATKDCSIDQVFNSSVRTQVVFKKLCGESNTTTSINVETKLEAGKYYVDILKTRPTHADRFPNLKLTPTPATRP